MAPARSQKYTTKRSSQPGPSRVPLTQDTDDEGATQEQEEPDVNLDDEPIVSGLDVEVNRKAADLVRLALFSEQRRAVLRRDEITKKVLGSNTRLFNRVYVQANGILNKTFGMELVELPSRANISQSTNDVDGQEDELEEARKATGMRKKVAASGSKVYMLRSTLCPELLEAASRTDDQILEEEIKDMPEDDEDYFSEGGHAPRNYGSIISWSRNEHPGPIGILYVVLALILVNGRTIPDTELRGTLRRLRLPAGGEVAFSSISTHNTLSIDQYLASLIRQSYVDREQVVDARGGKGKGNKRSRATQAITQEDEDGGVAYQWRWGPRAFCEVGEKAIAKFVAELMLGERDDADADDEEGDRAEPSRRGRGRETRTAEAKMQKMLDGIEKAAGGNLTSLL